MSTTDLINVDDGTIGDDSTNTTSLSDRYRKAIAMIESSTSLPLAMTELRTIQEQIAHLAMFSSNEAVCELSTSSIPFFSLEHYLAISYMNVPTTDILQRQQNLFMACNLWNAFLRRLETLRDDDSDDKNNNNDNSINYSSIVLSRDEIQQYNDLIEITNQVSKQQQESSSSTAAAPIYMPPPVNRDVKIARYQMKVMAEKERQRLQSLQERRHRIGIDTNEEFDGYDEDGILRAIAFTSVRICKAEAFDEWINVVRELPMIATMVQHQQQQQEQSSRYSSSGNQAQNSSTVRQDDRSNNRSAGPLKVTHITQNPISGQLNIRKEEIRAGVFRPGWNQPTMSLEELATREVEAAMERDQRQKVAEQESMHQPKRYEQLLKDGNEDNVDLVDASAELDRKWDDWKDENPRGSGNKRGDVGDRNF